MNKRIGLYNFDNISAIEEYFSDKNVDVAKIDNLEDIDNYNLVVTNNCIQTIKDEIINVHPSLLPAFQSEKAIADAFNQGVKVSGVTIHSKDKIIAQYPILIGTNNHIDDFINEFNSVTNILLPYVIESILEDKVFDFQDLFSSPCHRGTGCSKCGGCH